MHNALNSSIVLKGEVMTNTGNMPKTYSSINLSVRKSMARFISFGALYEKFQTMFDMMNYMNTDTKTIITQIVKD